MIHREFEGWDEYSRRLAASADAGSPEWARLTQSEAVMQAKSS